MSQPAHQPAERGGISTVPSFEALQAAVRTGDGIVARFPGLVLAAANEVGVERLLEICREVSVARSRSPGKAVARRLAGWLAEVDEPVDFGVVAATDDALAVFLCGRAALLVPGEPALSGTQAAAWVDRLIPWPPTSFVLTLGAGESATPVPLLSPHTFLDLRSGVVPGGGLLLAAPDVRYVTSAPAPAPPASVLPADAPPAEEIPPLPRPTVAIVEQPQPALEPPTRAEAISGVPPEEERREPLPEIVPADGSVTPSQPEPQGVLVEGFLCSRGHLNDPRAMFCAGCGIRMAERTGVLVQGVRPPLGLLVFDDGASFTLDDDYLLGRQPDVDKRVQEGAMRPLLVDDSSRLVSRSHLEIMLQGWDVYITDTGTANGTYVQVPEAHASSALVPHQPLRLPPGARVSIGNRSFIFESSLAR